MLTLSTQLKVGVILPVFNVEKTIERVLLSISEENIIHIAEILIIDNGSNDKTVEIIKKTLKRNKLLASLITLILHGKNYGYGCSIKAGFLYFSQRPVTHVMVIHGDYQVNPNWLMQRFFRTLDGSASLDVVLASRFTKESNTKGYSMVRRFGNYFFNTFTFLCTGLRMSDSGAAMIIMRRCVLEKIPFEGLSNSWQFHPQLNILIFDDKLLKIKEIPTNWEDSEAPSTVPLFRYGINLLKILIKYRYARTILKKDVLHIFNSDPMPTHRQFTVHQETVI